MAIFRWMGSGGCDVEHYLLQVRYEPSSDRLSGVATISARATHSLSRFKLDFDGLDISAGAVDGSAASWARADGDRRRRAALGDQLVPADDHPRDRAARTFEVTVPEGLELVANGAGPAPKPAPTSRATISSPGPKRSPGKICASYSMSGSTVRKNRRCPRRSRRRLRFDPAVRRVRNGVRSSRTERAPPAG